MKQYNSLKPIKRGNKIWMRADMDGYISKFSIYQGKNSDTVTMHNPPSCFGLGEQVVFLLTEDLFGKIIRSFLITILPLYLLHNIY